MEKSLWQRFHRVPDHVNLAHAVPNPAAQAARDASILTQHAYASMALSPLVFGSLARRR